jgi:hypothetical protein
MVAWLAWSAASYGCEQSCSTWAWFSTFLKKALVNRANRRVCIRILRLDRSANDVLMWSGLGLPSIAVLRAPMRTRRGAPALAANEAASRAPTSPSSIN